MDSNSIPAEFPISLQSWPSKEKDPSSTLPTLISRINFERGGFRNLTEDGLRQEIAEAEAGEGEESSSDEEEDEKPDRMKELKTARDEMVVNLDQAHQGTLFALDFISLLLSKDQPNQGGSTISPFLREAVGVGTLGADKLTVPRITEEQQNDNKSIAKGWKLQNLNKSVDSILASATRLEKEIEVETKYWEQVLEINEKGWAISRIPQEKHILGVRFGFLEAAAAFQNRSLAALRREKDGNILLDQGIASTEPRALRVRIRVNNQETGSSPISAPAPEDSPIEPRILEARNTLFATELWQELNREARTLAAYGVRSKDDTITCPINPTKTMVFDLIPLEEKHISDPQLDDKLAEGVSLALHLLLSYQHRNNGRRRQNPPPLSPHGRPNPPYNLLRPLITRLDHQRALTHIHALLVPLCAALTTAGLSPSYTTTSSPTPATTSTLSPTETTILNLIDRLESVTTLKLTGDVTIVVTARTAMFPNAGTIFTLALVPDDGPLSQTCRPPPSSVDTWLKAEDYLLFAAGCALAASYVAGPVTTDNGIENVHDNENADALEPADGKPNGNESEGWRATVQPYILRKAFTKTGRNKQLLFQVRRRAGRPGLAGEEVRVRVGWEWMGDEDGAAGERKAGRGEGAYEWVSRIGDDVVRGRGRWEEGEGEVVRGMGDVVAEAGRG